jgi:flagellar biogenesis protein FliO
VSHFAGRRMSRSRRVANRRLVLIAVALALVLLAVGGWTVQALKALA